MFVWKYFFCINAGSKQWSHFVSQGKTKKSSVYIWKCRMTNKNTSLSMKTKSHIGDAANWTKLRYNQTSVSKPAQTVLGILLNIYLTGENTSLRPQTPPSEQGHEAWCVCGFCSGKELVHAKVQKVWMLNVKIQSFFKTFRNKACSKTKLFNIQQYTLY